ncbi:hypothetical protein [Streptomyces sp. NBC_01435]|uniref:hypothetical protein n=1 Tax=Streptomyces sp. NBC_01435 TaxID=2903865 RepID=UPI002E330F3A|nr:hypothetical protein [Streptomyces sp. NBC_01435]
MLAAEALADAYMSGGPAQLAGAGVAESVAGLELRRHTDEFGAVGVQTATASSMSSTAMRTLFIRRIGVVGLLGAGQTR